ncbi:MAG: thioesterase family protein [Acidimicrobiales bacterium]
MSPPYAPGPDPARPTGWYFDLDGDRFVGTDHARGPWNPGHCHAGPPTGLLARAVERALAEAGVDHQLVRLTVALTRPIPMAGFSATAVLTRTGRSVSTAQAELVAGGTTVATATALAIRHDLDTPVPSTGAPDRPRLDEATAGRFPLRRLGHGRPGFSESTETRYPPGESPDRGPTTVWMRTVPLLAGETPSPFQAICPLADCGNAISRNAEPDEIGFLNPDLTIVLHRPPEGEWFASRSRSYWEPTGVGQADALLFDHRGPVGRAVQSLLLSPQPGYRPPNEAPT